MPESPRTSSTAPPRAGFTGHPQLRVLPGEPDVPSDCTDCGACCRQNGSPVLLYNSRLGGSGDLPHPYRPVNLPAELVAEIDTHFLGLHRGQEPPGPCLWYDATTHGCRHYQWRPQICRDFEVGSPSCLADRRAAGTTG